MLCRVRIFACAGDGVLHGHDGARPSRFFPGGLIKSTGGVRRKKRFFWDQAKTINRHWLAASMATEAAPGFTAFNTKKITGQDLIDFIEYRRLISRGAVFDADLAAAVLPRPKQK